MELSVRQYKRRGWADDMMEWRCAEQRKVAKFKDQLEA